ALGRWSTADACGVAFIMLLCKTCGNSSQPFPGHEPDQINDAAGIAPLVVIPRENLDHVAAEDFGVFGVNDGRERVAAKIARHERLSLEAEDAFERAFSRSPQRGVHVLGGRLLLRLD